MSIEAPLIDQAPQIGTLTQEELNKIVKIAQKRNISLPNRVPEDFPKPEEIDGTFSIGRLYSPLTPRSNQIMRAIGWVFIPGISLGRVLGKVPVIEEFKGEEFIPQIIELTNSGPVTGVGNHLTDLDHEARRRALEQVSHQDLADKLAYYAGYKMDERVWTRVFMGAENTLYCPTPFDLDDAENASVAYQQKENLTLVDQGILAILDEYSKNLTLTDRAGGRVKIIALQLRKHGFIPYVYPESTRSRSGFLEEGHPKTAGVFGRDGYIFSMVVTGHREAAAPGKKWNPLGKRPLRVAIGEPYLAREPYQWMVDGKKRGENRNIVTYIMAKMAQTMRDEDISPKMLATYREIAPIERTT